MATETASSGQPLDGLFGNGLGRGVDVWCRDGGFEFAEGSNRHIAKDHT